MGSQPLPPVMESLSNGTFSYSVGSGCDRIRLDQFLALMDPATSRSLFADAIASGLVVVDGMARKSSYRLRAGEVVTGRLPQRTPPEVAPQQVDFVVLFEDEHLLALSKPPGLVVHPGSGNADGTLVNGLLHHCLSIGAVGDALRPGIVHRLDKDTSGVMLVAKRDEVHRRLVDDFKNRRLTKEYLALAHGRMRQKSGRIVASIGRHPRQRQKMAVLAEGGRHAASNWEVLRQFHGPLSLLRVTIETGRTHQIRVHLAHLGHPVVGDETYGGRPVGPCKRQLLHAFRLVFRHPVTQQEMEVSAPLWPDFATVLEGLDEIVLPGGGRR